MKLVFNSEEQTDVAWLAWGRQKLAALTKIIKGSFTKQYTPSSEVVVTLHHTAHAPAQDYVRVDGLPLGLWFGYGGQLKSRVWARVPLASVSVPAVSTTSTIVYSSVADPGYGGLAAQYTQAGSVYVGTVLAATWTGTASYYWPTGPSSPPDDGARYSFSSYSGPAWGLSMSGLVSGSYYFSGAANQIVDTRTSVAVETRFAAEIAAARAAQGSASRVYMSDGVQVGASGQINGNPDCCVWNGGFNYRFVGASPSAGIDYTVPYTPPADMTVPRSTSFRVASPDSDTYYAVGVYSPRFTGVLTGQTSQYRGFIINRAGSTLTGTDISTAQGVVDVLLSQEYARRKRNSDAMLDDFRAGKLPADVDRQIKTYHPAGAKVQRRIPMTATSGPTYTQTGVVTSGGVTTTTWTGSVTLSYTAANGTVKSKTFSGTCTRAITTHSSSGGSATSTVYTYSGLPLFRTQDGASKITLSTSMGIDAAFAAALIDGYPAFLAGVGLDVGYYTWPLFGVLDGTFTYAPSSVPTDQFWDSDGYPPALDMSVLPTATPAYPTTSAAITFTHPQFLYDYFADSAQEEVLTSSGVLVTPTLIDKETVMAVPLSFVAGGTEIGLFPYASDTSVVPTHIKVYGYARYRYTAATGALSFVKWVELTTPQFIVYDHNWGRNNVVFFAEKTKWSDVKVKAKAQKALVAHPVSADYQLYAAVKQALHSQ